MDSNTQSLNYSLFAKTLVNRYIDSISGRLLDDVFVDRKPTEKIMIGRLASSRVEKSFDKGYVENKQNQFTSIPSINVNFSIKKSAKGSIVIKPSGLLFFTVAPDYEKTVDYILSEISEKSEKKYKTIKELSDECLQKIQLPYTYRKIDIGKYMGDGISISISDIVGNCKHLQDDIAEKLAVLEEQIAEEIKVCKLGSIYAKDLLTEDNFKKVAKPKDERVVPRWAIDVFVDAVDEGDSIRFTIQMVNNTATEVSEINGYLPDLFDANISITGKDVEFIPVELDYFRSSFKDRDPIYAVSENISVYYDNATNSLITNNVPLFYQYRLKTRQDLDEFASFDALLLNPVENLSAIALHMDNDYRKCSDDINCISSKALGGFKNALEEYRQEIDRFKKGIEQIKYRDNVKKAFNLMLRAFKYNLPGETRAIKGWRLFQIVFIVSLIPEVIRCEYSNDVSLRFADDEVANLLYFPTGGGKTEAFLGVCVFSMFFDRLRGKNEGITAILKYPLRLLAVQQLDRVLTVVTKANKIKEETEDIRETNDFAVGFFVGKTNTPNKIDRKEPLSLRAESNNTIREAVIEADEATLDDWYRFIDTCPTCGKKMVHMRFNHQEWKLEHVCNNPECTASVLPLYIVDNEIYRYLPSLVVSTIDKMAMVGLSGDFKAIMGQVRNRCLRHGLTPYNRCLCANCRDEVIPLKKPLKDPIPTLFIQDELHLVKESLGTFDAHYESFINYYAKELVPAGQRKKIRYIGATATISMYQNHINELYHMNGRRFPCEYPSRSRGEDFYSYTDNNDISRIMLGFAPYGKSITEGMWLSVYYMRLAIYHYIENAESEYLKLVEEGFNGSLDDYKEMLYNYWIQLVYNNRKQDATELDNAFQNQGNNYLGVKGIPLFNSKAMTSDVDFQAVRKTLFDIQENHRNLNSTNLILATSTISHGVDEDSFNSMFFFGMPNNNAEYIQAYSRVGRKYTGIVVDIIRLMRIRDRSYLKNFIEFHSNKDDLVETVPINRWARNAVYCTLPGILAGLFYQYYSAELNEEQIYRPEVLRKLLKEDRIKESDVIEKIIAAYGCRSQEKLSEVYKEEIENEVKIILEGIKNENADASYNISDAIGHYSVQGKRPMSSLRDTDEQIELDLRR